MTRRRLSAVPLLLLVLLLSSACSGSIMKPQGWANAAVVGDSSTAVVSLDKGRVSAVDLATGQELWRFPNPDRFADQDKLNPTAFYGQPIVDGDAVYVAGYESQVYALNINDGSLRWKIDSGIRGKIIGGLALQGDLLSFGTGDGHVYQLRKADGSPAPGWTSQGLNLGAPIWSAPVYGNGVLFVATLKGEVRALRIGDGSDAWQAPFKTAGSFAELALLGADRLFVPSLDNNVYLLDAATGRPVGAPFKASDWVWNRPAYRDGVVYFGDFEGQVYALDITEGGFRQRWSQKVSGRVKSGPLLLGSTLVVGTRDSIVYFLQASDGRASNSVPLLDSGTIRASVTEYRGSGLIVTTAGKLFLAEPQALRVTPVQVGSAP